MLNNTIVIGLVGGVAAVSLWLAYGPASEPVTDAPEAPASEARAVHIEATPARKPVTPSAMDSFWRLREPTDHTIGNEPQHVAAASDPGVKEDESERQATAFDVEPIEVPSAGEDVDYTSVGDEGTIDGQPSRDEMASNLEARFLAEAYDTRWARETEGELLQLFGDAELEGSQLTEAACRTTLCLIDVTHVDSVAEERFIAAFATSTQFVSNDETGFYYRSVDYNGEPRTVFFWARKGHQLDDAAF